MNIKTFLWISQCFFEEIHPNIYDDEDKNSEVDQEILDDMKKDYLYLQDCYKGIMLFINPIKKD
jgi:hypothetical protein